MRSIPTLFHSSTLTGIGYSSPEVSQFKIVPLATVTR